MADTYIDLGFPDNADPDVKLQASLTVLQTGIDGYDIQQSAGSPEQITIEAGAEAGADNEWLVAHVLAPAAFRSIGANLVGFPTIDAQAAQATVVVTASASAGGTIESGVTQIVIAGVGFIAAQDVTIAAGASVSVTFVALIDGTDGNGLTGTPSRVTQLAWVTDLTLAGPTSGGVDAEDDAAYQGRLARKMQSLGRPILAIDFAEMMSENANVSRTLVLDGYDAVALTSGNDKTVTLVPIKTDGSNVSTSDKDERKAAILAEREVGWNVYVIDPTRIVIDVSLTGKALPGNDHPTVATAVQNAISGYLDPATFAAGDQTNPTLWGQRTSILRTEITALANLVPGFDSVDYGTVLLGLQQAVTAAAATDLVTLNAHGFSNTDPVHFTGLTGGAPLVAGTTYYVRDVTTNTFKLAATSGGTAIDITTDMTAGTIHHLANGDLALPGVAPLPAAGEITVTIDA